MGSLCACGCGAPPSPGKRYIYTHQNKGNKNALGLKHTEITKQKMRAASKGNKYALGYKHTEETRKRLSDAAKNMSAETRQKISEAGMGRVPTEATRKKISEKHKGRVMSKEWKRKNSEARKGKGTGPANANWQGGVCPNPYPPAFNRALKKQTKERDGGKCQNPGCWGTTEVMGIHHIDYNKENCEGNNLITLCNSCNARANKGREFWMAFYRKIMRAKFDDNLSLTGNPGPG